MKRKNLFGCALIIVAVAQFFIGANSLVAIQSVALLEPSDIWPLALCIAAPAVLFLMGAILAFKNQLFLSTRSLVKGNCE